MEVILLLLVLIIRLSHAFSFTSTPSMSSRRANTPIMRLFQQQQYYNTKDQENYSDDESDGMNQNYADLADQYYANENQGQYDYQQQPAAEFYNDPSRQQMYNEQQQQYYNNNEEYNENQQHYYNNNEEYNEQQQQQQQPSPSLLITGNMQEELQRATSNIDVPLDYLALARQRAMERRVSTNSLAGDTDWLHLANEKKKQQRSTGEDDDDWVASLNDEGSVSDLLSVVGVRVDEGSGMLVTESGIVVDMDNNNDDDGPRLLL